MGLVGFFGQQAGCRNDGGEDGVQGVHEESDGSGRVFVVVRVDGEVSLGWWWSFHWAMSVHAGGVLRTAHGMICRMVEGVLKDEHA